MLWYAAFSAGVQVQGHVDDALANGAKALTGGSKPEMQAPYDKGYFFQPTVLSDCTIDMKVSDACIA